MKRWCPVCGRTFSWAKRWPVAQHHAARHWVEHVWACYREQGGPWNGRGSRKKWESISLGHTIWQAKRIALIRDAVPFDADDLDNPWVRHPRCQSCGIISTHTVTDTLHGSANGFEIQHILPRSRGGESHPHNLAVLCRRCHVRTFKSGYAGVPRGRVRRLEWP
jgi:5-methylcytosine-specific restriction endonuclease McrA